MELIFGRFWDQIMQEYGLSNWMIGAAESSIISFQEAMMDMESKEDHVDCDTSEKESPNESSEDLDVTDSDASPLNANEQQWPVEETVLEETEGVDRNSPIPTPSPIPETQELIMGMKRRREDEPENFYSAKHAREEKEDDDDSKAIWLD